MNSLSVKLGFILKSSEKLNRHISGTIKPAYIHIHVYTIMYSTWLQGCTCRWVLMLMVMMYWPSNPVLVFEKSKGRSTSELLKKKGRFIGQEYQYLCAVHIHCIIHEIQWMYCTGYMYMHDAWIDYKKLFNTGNFTDLRIFDSHCSN